MTEIMTALHFRDSPADVLRQPSKRFSEQSSAASAAVPFALLLFGKNKGYSWLPRLYHGVARLRRTYRMYYTVKSRKVKLFREKTGIFFCFSFKNAALFHWGKIRFSASKKVRRKSFLRTPSVYSFSASPTLRRISSAGPGMRPKWSGPTFKR